MNAQMKAVGRQAGLVFIEDGVYGHRWYSSKCGLDASEYEKLVQAIVKECAQMLDEDTYLIPELGGYAHDMRQRFGIQD
jgi:hypothetical protein